MAGIPNGKQQRIVTTIASAKCDDAGPSPESSSTPSALMRISLHRVQRKLFSSFSAPQCVQNILSPSYPGSGQYLLCFGIKSHHGWITTRMRIKKKPTVSSPPNTMAVQARPTPRSLESRRIRRRPTSPIPSTIGPRNTKRIPKSARYPAIIEMGSTLTGIRRLNSSPDVDVG
jgi:hypothetical protein